MLRRRLTVRGLARGIGELAMTAGVLVLLFVVYELWFTNLIEGRSQDRLEQTLHRQWGATSPARVGAVAPGGATTPGDGPIADPGPPQPTVAPGQPFALLQLPTIPGYRHVVVEGVDHEDLKQGPGHYPGTPQPGQVGNVVISGHRTTYGAPFRQVDKLTPGSPVVLETRDRVFRYTVLREQIVRPDAVGVLLPVPDKPGVLPTQRLLTLTTCHPPLSAAYRLVIVAELASTSSKDN